MFDKTVPQELAPAKCHRTVCRNAWIASRNDACYGRYEGGPLLGPQGVRLGTSAPAPRDPAGAGRPAPAASRPAETCWLLMRLHADLDRHDRLLAEHLPVVLEALPDGVPGWSFSRHTSGGPHLRLRFRGASDAVRCRLVPGLRRWVADLVHAALDGPLVITAEHPDTAEHADPGWPRWPTTSPRPTARRC